MTKKDVYTLLLVAAEALIILVLSLLLFHACRKPADIIKVPVEVHDTITVTKERIIEHTKVEYVTVFDTMIVVEGHDDTIQVPVELPIEHMMYQDTIRTDSTDVELAIKYSGFKPSLDSVGISYHYVGERAVEVKKTGFRRFVGVGAYVGAGVGYDLLRKDVVVTAPEVGVCVTVGWGYTW